MDLSEIPQRLGRIENLKAFADASGLDRRWLQRIIAGERDPGLSSLQRIEEALKAHRPKLRPVEDQAA